MNGSMLLGLAASAALLWNGAQAAEMIEERSANISFPAKVTFEDEGKNYTLDATGTATRKKFFVQIYTVAHYMEKPDRGNTDAVIDEILNSPKTKQLTVHWLRPVNGAKIKEGYREALTKAVSKQEYAQFSKQLDTFTNLFSRGVHKGDEHILRWMGDGTLVVLVDGKEAGSISDGAFSKALWEIWFGPRSVVNKSQLVDEVATR